ncbi:MAG: DUF2169 domain-containing protein [Polyangiaceae bacterium]
MHVKNTSPFLVGWRVTSRTPPQREMTVVVRGTFTARPAEPLTPAEDQGTLTSEVYWPDDDDRAGECLYGGDFADFKLNAEVLLHGTCHAPGKHPVRECPVRVRIGDWSKTVRVVGKRTWSDRTDDARISEPQPFNKLPLGFKQAFGGPGFIDNPVGKGFGGEELPTLERPGFRIRSRRDLPSPVSFGPINPSWPLRANRVGKQYDADYKKKRAPFYAQDFDWRYFHSAPDDQQLPGYLRGDEDITFENLHPTEPSLILRLPALRVRVFAKDKRGLFSEVAMNLDTLFANLDDEAIVLTWRGLVPVREDDLSDMSALRVATEPLDAEPLAATEYRADLDAFEADPLGFNNALPPGLVQAADALEAKTGAVAAQGKHAPAGQGPSRMTNLVEHLQGASAEELTRVLATGTPPPVANDQVEATGFRVPKAKGAAPPHVSLKAGTAPNVKVKPAVQPLLLQVEEARAREAQTGQRVSGLEEAERSLEDPSLQKIDPTFRPPRRGDPPPPEPGPYRDCRGVDWTDRDLTGADLSGSNLEGAILTGARLRGAKLVGAKLRYAVLYRADLEGADLTGADLTMVQASHCLARGLLLAEANLSEATFERSDLGGANLERCRGEYVRFTKANLAHANLVESRLPHAHFDNAFLTSARLGRAKIAYCLFKECDAASADMESAVLTRSSFEGVNLSGARLTRVVGEWVGFIRANLDDADLTEAWLTNCHFSEASACRAVFKDANLREAIFYRAKLETSSFRRANLFSVDFRKATVTEASFRDANLYDAKFIDAAGKGADFVGANLKRSTLENP